VTPVKHSSQADFVISVICVPPYSSNQTKPKLLTILLSLLSRTIISEQSAGHVEIDLGRAEEKKNLHLKDII
jgi:hypothetical protein